MKKGIIIVTAASFIIGLAEALIYYNMGKNQNQENTRWSVPPATELAKTAGVVIITSVATAIVTGGLEKAFQKKSTELAI